MARTKSSKSKLSRQQLKAAITRLKRAGLSDIVTGSPTKRERDLARLIIRDESKAVKLTAAMAKRYEETTGHGIQIIRSGKKNIAIVSNRIGYTKTQISKGEPIFEGMVARVRPLKNGEIETIVLPINSTSIPKFIEQLKDHPSWNGLKTKSERFTLRFNVEGNFYGLNDPQQFGTMQQLATFLQGYKSAFAASQSSRKSQKDYLEMLEIVRIKKNGADLRNAEQIERFNMKKKLAAYKRKRKQRGG